MANLSDEELSRIVEEQMPGYKVIPPTPTSDAFPAALPPEATTPDLATLRAKYLGTTAPAPAPADGAEAPNAPEPRIMLVAPKQMADTPEQPMAPKAVVVSPDTGKIIGHQG